MAVVAGSGLVEEDKPITFNQWRSDKMARNEVITEALGKKVTTLEKRIEALEKKFASLKDKLIASDNQKPVDPALYKSALRAQTVGNNNPLEEYLKLYRVPAETSANCMGRGSRPGPSELSSA